MNFHTSGFDHFAFDPPLAAAHSHSSSGHAQSPLYPDRIPPPASVATINGDAIDLNDEVFFRTAQTAASPVPPASNYLLDSYHIDPMSFAPEVSAPAAADQLKPSHSYHKGAPSHSQSAQPEMPVSAGFSPPPEAAQAASQAHFLTSAGEPRSPDHDVAQGVDHDVAQGVKSALSTPDLAFAEPMSYNVHYSHQHRFSTAVEQMHRMSLGRSPSELATEEKTINPRQLLGFSAASSLSSLQNYLAIPDREDAYMQASSPDVAPELSATAAKSSSSPATRYLSTSISSPSLSTFFSSQIPDLLDRSEPQAATPALNNPLNPYVMNDECVSAITYWLNNTANVIQEKDEDGALDTAQKQPARGLPKPYWNRRNSIQVVPGTADAASGKSVQKRKRRKSDHLSVKDDKSGFSDLRFMQRAAESAPDSAFAVISETDPSLTSAVSDGADFHEPSLHPKDDGAMEQRNSEPARPGEGGLASLAEGEDDGPKPFPCPDCEKQFKRSEHLKRHIRSVHSNIRPFHCKYCEKKFSRSDNLAQHSKTHFKINANGTTSVIYGNPNPHNRGGRKQSISEMALH